jgi:hypothetical protein
MDTLTMNTEDFKRRQLQWLKLIERLGFDRQKSREKKEPTHNVKKERMCGGSN